MKKTKKFKANYLETVEGNLLISVMVNRLTEYLYMDKQGNFLPSKREREQGKKVTPQEWAWAKKEWGKEIKSLTSPEDEARVRKALKQRKGWLHKHHSTPSQTHRGSTYSIGDVLKQRKD